MKKKALPEVSPDHSHYAAYEARKAEIDIFSRNVFVYTAGISLILLFFTFIGVDIPVISWIPEYFGDPTELGHLFSQTAELVLFTLTSFIAYGKRKYLHIPIFFAYVSILVGSLFDGRAISAITVIIGIIGIIVTKDCFSCCTDYRQLIEAEGWPHFNIHLTEHEEHPSYTSRYASELSKAPADKVEAYARIMSRSAVPKKTSPKPAPLRPEPLTAKPDEIPSMEEMPSIMTISSDAPDAPDADFFEPDSGLYDDISDI